MAASNAAILILGDQLIHPRRLGRLTSGPVIMGESAEFIPFRYHQIKLAWTFSAMRHAAAEYRSAGHQVCYHRLEDGDRPLCDHIQHCRSRTGFDRLVVFEPADRTAEPLLERIAAELDCPIDRLPCPTFLTPMSEFRGWATGRRWHMADFYRWQRRRLDVLIDDGEPVGGRWSFDSDNRQALPASHSVPDLEQPQRDAIDTAVIALVQERFADHPGDAGDLWLPTTRRSWGRWWRTFLRQRLRDFGPYQDALADRSVLHHAVIALALNHGLLEPGLVVDQAIAQATRDDLPIASVEGFVRQIIGWREFVRGIDQLHGAEQARGNHWHHDRDWSAAWLRGDTGIAPVDDLLHRLDRSAYAHHIERLMVFGNLANLLGIRPRHVYRWFMERFVDSASWVMGPNVYGMALMSDGGSMTTKPYLCGSNYWRRMGWPSGPWQDAVDGLYWDFIERHRSGLQRNPRMAQACRTLDRLNPDRRRRIARAAADCRERLTRTG